MWVCQHYKRESSFTCRLSEKDVVVGGSLVDMYTKCRSLKDARLMFDRLSEKDDWLFTLIGCLHWQCDILELHHAGSFPFQVIAPVTYMWKPMQTVADEPGEEGTMSMMEEKRLNPGRVRHLWIWIHAAAVEKALESLQAACKSQGGIVCCRSRLAILGGLMYWELV